MSRGLQKFVWIVLLAGLLPVQGSFYDNMDDTNENDYSSDDDILEDRINSSDDKEENSKALIKPRNSTLKLLSNPQKVVVEEGGTVYLHCEVENAARYTVLWRNGTKDTLYVDHSKVKEEKRIFKFYNHTLIIVNVSIYDSGDYMCQIIAPDILQVIHNVLVYRNLTLLYMLPEVENNKPFTVVRGESVTLVCNVTGYPPPQILWVKMGDHINFPNGQQIMEGETLHFKRVGRTFTGTYKCKAKNAVQLVQGSVDILVQHPPEIEIEQETMTSKVGLKPHLMCKVYAEPPATVSWYKNNKPIKDKTVYTFSQKKNIHFVEINKMTEGDFGNYKCVATNFLGVEEKTIILSGSPTKPVFKSDQSTDKNMVQIRWFTESYTPIIEYEFQYKTLKDDVWTKLTPIIIQSVQDNIYTAKVILLGLPPDNYKVRVRARNSHGWSLFSDEREFKGDTPSRGGPPVIKPIVTVLPFIVAVCVCYL